MGCDNTIVCIPALVHVLIPMNYAVDKLLWGPIACTQVDIVC